MREGDGVTVKMQGVEMVKVDEFKHLEPTIQSYGRKERRRSGVICDRQIAARVKGMDYKMVARPAVIYGLRVGDTDQKTHS